MGGGVGWREKLVLKLTSAKVEVEVEAELGNILKQAFLIFDVEKYFYFILCHFFLICNKRILQIMGPSLLFVSVG